MNAKYAKKLLKKAKVKYSMSIYHQEKIRTACLQGINYIKLEDFNESTIVYFQSLGFKVIVYSNFGLLKSKSYLVVSW